MGASSATPNLDLPLFADGDRPSWRGDVNGAMELLDAAFGLVPGQISTAIDASEKRSGKVVSIWGYGAKGNGVDADDVAFADASTAAGVGGTVKLGKGTFGQNRFKLTAPIVMPDFQVWESDGNARIGGTAPQSHIDATALTGTVTAITTGRSSTLRNLRIAGPGSGSTVTGVTNVGSTQTLDNVSIVDFNVGVYWNNVYYGQLFNQCEFARCGTGLRLTQCYNVTLMSPRIHCLSTDGASRGTGIEITDKCRNLNIISGSIEQYSTAVKGASNSGHNLNAVYFETAAGSAKGVDCANKANFTVNVDNCLVYLSETLYWVNVAGGTNFVLNGRGNHFVCVTSVTPNNPTAYFHGANPVGDIDLRGDDWSDVSLATALYVPAVNGVYPRMTVAPPGTIDPTYVKQGRSPVRPLKIITAAYTIVPADQTIIATITGAVALTLPDKAATPLMPTGRTYTIKNAKSSTANLSVMPNGAYLDQQTTAFVMLPGDKITVIYDGSNWHIV